MKPLVSILIPAYNAQQWIVILCGLWLLEGGFAGARVSEAWLRVLDTVANDDITRPEGRISI